MIRRISVLAYLFLGLYSFESWGASKLVVMMAMDTDAENLQNDIATDFNNLTEVIGEVRREREEKVEWYKLTGGDLTPDNIRAFFQNRNFGNDTAILFVYSGHGGLDASGQFLAMAHGKIYREEIRRLMEETGTLLQVLITDCCANIAGVEPPKRRVPAEWEMFQQLFMDTEGLVDINASQEGSVSWSNAAVGGFFLNSFIRLLCEPISRADYDSDGRVTWNEFGGALKRETENLFNTAQALASDSSPIKEYQTQSPTFYYLAGANRDEEMKKLLNAEMNQLIARTQNLVNQYGAFQATVQTPRNRTYALAIADRFDAFANAYDQMSIFVQNTLNQNVARYGKRHPGRNQNRVFYNATANNMLALMTSLLQSRNSQYERARQYRRAAARL